MNITVRVEAESVKELLLSLKDVDIDIIEIFAEDYRQKPNLHGPTYRGDAAGIANSTAEAARSAVQNG